MYIFSNKKKVNKNYFTYLNSVPQHPWQPEAHQGGDVPLQ